MATPDVGPHLQLFLRNSSRSPKRFRGSGTHGVTFCITGLHLVPLLKQANFDAALGQIESESQSDWTDANDNDLRANLDSESASRVGPMVNRQVVGSSQYIQLSVNIVAGLITPKWRRQRIGSAA